MFFEKYKYKHVNIRTEMKYVIVTLHIIIIIIILNVNNKIFCLGGIIWVVYRCVFKLCLKIK